MAAQASVNNDVIRVQSQDFDLAIEYQKLREISKGSGAVVIFVGLVREFSQSHDIKSLFLEHYPAMTELSLKAIVDEAKNKWPLDSICLIHRIGHLSASEQIVLVGVSSKHRHAAFSGAEYIMDFLKVRAPFWKKEITHSGEFWVEAKKSDKLAAEGWLKEK